MGKNVVAWIAAAIATVATAAPAAAFTVAVSPSRIEETLTGRPVTQTLKIINYGTEPTLVKIRVANFDLDDGNRVREIAPTAESLDRWILIRPLEVRIEPGKSETVRLAIRPLGKARDGEHRAMIFIEQVGAAAVQQPNALPVAYELGVAVYAYVGPKRIASKLHGLKVSAEAVTLDVESLGNANSRVTGHFAIWPADRAPAATAALAQVAALATSADGEVKAPANAVAAGALPGLPVLPGTRRNLVTPFAAKLAPGRYQVVIRGKVGEIDVARVIPFEVKPS